MECVVAVLVVAKAGSERVHAKCRENTEGEYSGLEHEVVPDVVESLKVHSCPHSAERLSFGAVQPS